MTRIRFVKKKKGSQKTGKKVRFVKKNKVPRKTKSRRAKYV